MKIVMTLSFAIFFAACSYSLIGNIEPQFFSNYFTGLEKQKITKYESAKLDYDLTSPSNENIHFSSCRQVAVVRDSDILMSEYHLLTMLRLNCRALKKYTLAANSNKSYLHDILIGKDVSKLPATAYPFVNDYDRKSRLEKKLKDYHKIFTIKQANDGVIEVVTETDSLLYQVIATGDFNGDKIEDALIRIDWRVIDAFGKGSKLVLITKTSPGLDYEEINLD